MVLKIKRTYQMRTTRWENRMNGVFAHNHIEKAALLQIPNVFFMHQSEVQCNFVRWIFLNVTSSKKVKKRSIRLLIVMSSFVVFNRIEIGKRTSSWYLHYSIPDAFYQWKLLFICAWGKKAVNSLNKIRRHFEQKPWSAVTKCHENVITM